MRISDWSSDVCSSDLQGAGAVGAQGDRADRLAGPHPVGARPAEDALRQDHAPHPAQDRRERLLQPRRHLDAGRSRRGRRPHQQPHEPRLSKSSVPEEAMPIDAGTEVYAGFTLTGNDFDPDEVTRRVGLEPTRTRSEEQTSELQDRMRYAYADLVVKQKKD